MSYFIFTKDSVDIKGTLYRIAKDENDLNCLNIDKSTYKIIQDTIQNFDLIRLNKKIVVSYNSSDVITYQDLYYYFNNANELSGYISIISNQIKQFLDNNKNHPKFQAFYYYNNEINSLNLNTISYPLEISLEEYLNNNGIAVLNTLQIP
jgi:hypothetical protein